MKFKWIFIFFATLINFVLSNPLQNSLKNGQNNRCGERFGTRGAVVGGDKVTNRLDWPWLVAFIHHKKNKYFCGGSLISDRHVLGGK